MRNIFSKLALSASIMLAMTFTLSCSSGDDDKDGSTSSSSGGSISSPSNGGGGSSSSGGGGSGSCPTGISDTFVDIRDNKSYKTVKICDQTWFAENLNYDVPNNDTDVCYNNDPANCVTYGRLYDWVTAMGIDVKYNTEVWDKGPPASIKHQDNSEIWNGSDVKHQGICPAGWHLPSHAELVQLVENADGSTAKLKATNGWNDYNGNSGNGTDDYDFSALPGGMYGMNYDRFEYAGESGYWWSATNYPSSTSNIPLRLRIEYKNDVFDIRQRSNTITDLNSVRCVKD